MGSAHKMRCLMWRSRVRLESLATSLVCMYSPADGNETEGVASRISDGLRRAHAAVWILGLCQASGDERERPQTAGRGRAFHGPRAWSQTGVSRRVLQWLDQRNDADEDGGWLLSLVGRGAAG